MRFSSLLLIASVVCTQPLSAFDKLPEPQKVDAKLRDSIVRRATFVEHVSRNRPQLDAQRLTAMGAAPVERLVVGKTTFYLSSLFALDESHQVAVALVEVGDKVSARVLYRSNSQFSWRMCDAMNGNHIGKGFHEYDKQLPIAVTVALLRRADRVGKLQHTDGVSRADDSQYALADRLLSALTVDFQSSVAAKAVVVIGGKYVTSEYAKLMPRAPSRFSIVEGTLPTASGVRVADPAKTRLPPKEKLPDFENLIGTFKYKNPAYARFSRTDGVLKGSVYDSHDHSVRYLFFEDSLKRSVLSAVELLDAPINLLGLRSKYPDVAGMDAPLMEYAYQIPEKFSGRRRTRYQMNWKLVREQPIIKLYYERLGRNSPEVKEP